MAILGSGPREGYRPGTNRQRDRTPGETGDILGPDPLNKREPIQGDGLFKPRPGRTLVRGSDDFLHDSFTSQRYGGLFSNKQMAAINGETIEGNPPDHSLDDVGEVYRIIPNGALSDDEVRKQADNQNWIEI